MKQSERKKLRQAIEDSEKLRKIAAAGGKKRHKSSSPQSVGEVITNYILLGVALFIGAVIISLDLSTIYILHGNQLAITTVKVGMIVLTALTYLKYKQNIISYIFPKTNHEIIKTIYKIDPKTIEPKGSESNELEWDKKMLHSYMLIAIFAIAFITLIFAQPNFLGITLTLMEGNGIAATIFKIILVGLAFGIYLSFRNLVVVNKEYDYLQEVIWKVRHLRKQGNKKIPVHKILPTKEMCMVSEKLRAIIQVMKLKGEITTEDIADVSFIHHSIQESMPRYLASVMPVMGLIGTLLGLSMAIGGLEGVLSNAIDDREAFATSMSVALSGIGTAFYTTLEGMIAMMVMKFFNLIASNARMNLMADMENALVVEILPRITDKSLYKIQDKS